LVEYLTGLPPQQLLQQKLHKAIVLFKARLDRRAPGGLLRHKDTP
jgi:hypothetical protein